MLSDPSKRRALDSALAMYGSGAYRPAGGFGSYSSFYEQSDEEDERAAEHFANYFGSAFFGARSAGGYAHTGGGHRGGGHRGGGAYGGSRHAGGYGGKW